MVTATMAKARNKEELDDTAMVTVKMATSRIKWQERERDSKRERERERRE